MIAHVADRIAQLEQENADLREQLRQVLADIGHGGNKKCGDNQVSSHTIEQIYKTGLSV